VLGAQADDHALVYSRQLGQEVPGVFTLAAAGFDARIENVAGLSAQLSEVEKIFFHPTRLREESAQLPSGGGGTATPVFSPRSYTWAAGPTMLLSGTPTISWSLFS